MRTRASTLVGRDREVDRLVGLLDEARAGRGGAAFVIGEPGIGKSRLAVEAVRRAVDDGMVVLRGRASATGPTVPFRPLTEALLSLVRSGLPLPEDALGPYRPVLGRLVPEWSTVEAGPHGDSLIVLGEAILRLTAAVGDGRGCVLFLDDLHDADVESLAVVEYICDNLDTQSTALIATARSESGPAFDLVRSVVRRQSGTTVDLGRLGIADAPGFIAACLGGLVPTGLPERLWRDSAGVPFVVEELLDGMVDAGTLVRADDSWRLVDTAATAVPPTVARAIVARAERLGARGRLLCSAAAVVGRRFSLTVVQKVTGIDDRELLEHVHAGVEAQLIARDDHGTDWYSFQHPLTVEALRSRLTPLERADLSRRAADAVVDLHPDLPGEWCQLAALLRVGAEQPVEAAALFAQAGARALADGAAGSAVALLERAESLLAGAGAPAKRADVLEQLLYASAEHGQFDRAFGLADALADLPPRRRLALHVRLAWAGHIAGRWAEGMAQVAAARALLPPDADVATTAPVDVIAAYLALDGPGEDRHAAAEALARKVIDAGDEVAEPTVLCQAWQVIGVVARDRDLAEARACFDRVREVAAAADLPIWEVYGVIGEASIAWLIDSDVSVVERARDAALRVGAITLAENMSASIAMDSVLRGDFALAAAQIDEALRSVRRLRVVAVERYLYVVCATLAAHQGKRSDMERELASFRAAGNERAQERPLAHGLAGAFCALLEEDGALARRELATAARVEERSPTTFHLSGTNGLRVLLATVDGELSGSDLSALAMRSAAAMRWNRQFVLFAEAVALGAAGDAEAASAKAVQARAAGEPFAMAHALALRLVAESAHRDGWGEPVGWLREAEEHFHRAGNVPVASACRGLLRAVGESVRQRRAGTDRVPPTLRSAGVTIREYEVFELLPDRLGNKDLAARLHISPRTVEKHVASLVMKTGSADRAALVEFARRFTS